jgi:hypothetical protein
MVSGCIAKELIRQTAKVNRLTVRNIHRNNTVLYRNPRSDAPAQKTLYALYISL